MQDAYDYVIVGAGVAGASAARAIRRHDEEGTTLVIGREDDAPFYRPDLSKTLWLDESASSGTEPTSGWLLDDEAQADLVTGVSVTAIDTEAKSLALSDTSTVGYGRLLLATGAQPRTLDLPESDRILTYRTLADYRRLSGLVQAGSRAVVVGGGYIGAEVAAALAQNDVAVTLLMRSETVQGHMFPQRLAQEVTEEFRARGVTVVGGTGATSARLDGDTVVVTDTTGAEHVADVVIVGLGVTPEDQVAQQAGITAEDGIVVDDTLATSAPDVWAAGDVAQYEDDLLGVRRVEHVNNAERMGSIAAQNMVRSRIGTDEPRRYDYTPFFWSDLFDYGYEAVGILDSSLTTVEDFTDDGSAGVVYYVDGGTVRGVLLWNVWDSVDTAKAVMSQSITEPQDRDDLVGRIPLG
jgi:NADPH-dependent 2,4-dienoyl-CoA reductase/sulfur reductase-like enzyme